MKEKYIFLDDSTKPMSIEEVCEYFNIDRCESIEEVVEEIIRQNDGVLTCHTLWFDGRIFKC